MNAIVVLYHNFLANVKIPLNYFRFLKEIRLHGVSNSKTRITPPGIITGGISISMTSVYPIRV